MNKEVKENEAVQGLSPARRKLLKALTAGGTAAVVIPAEWAKPLVKSAVLPAHAQATGGGCGLNNAYYLADGASFCMCVSSQVPGGCGTSATVQVYNASGQVVASCASEAAISWSCSASGNGSGLGTGAQVTFVVTWEDGCVCSRVVNAA